MPALVLCVVAVNVGSVLLGSRLVDLSIPAARSAKTAKDLVRVTGPQTDWAANCGGVLACIVAADV